MAEFCGFKWSGREDSNLRPLPPEDAAPDGTRRFSVLSQGGGVSFDAACSRFLPKKGSDRTLDPCLSHPSELIDRSWALGHGLDAAQRRARRSGVHIDKEIIRRRFVELANGEA